MRRQRRTLRENLLQSSAIADHESPCPDALLTSSAGTLKTCAQRNPGAARDSLLPNSMHPPDPLRARLAASDAMFDARRNIGIDSSQSAGA